MRRERVFVSTCSHNKQVRSEVGVVWAGLATDRRYDVKLRPDDPKPYESGLNEAVRAALEQGFDWWLNIDADNPPIRNPLDLVDADLDVVGLPTPIWRADTKGFPLCFNALMREQDGWKPLPPERFTGLQEVDAVGSGALLVARRVLLRAPPFSRGYDEHGIAREGHDFRWCQEVRKRGFKIWAHFDHKCHHFKDMDLLEVWHLVSTFAAQRVEESRRG